MRRKQYAWTAHEHFARGQELLQEAENADLWPTTGGIATLATAHFAAAQAIMARAAHANVPYPENQRW